MRKEDRIRNQEQSRQPRERDSEQQMDERGREGVKGSASTAQPRKPERQTGKLPLPD